MFRIKICGIIGVDDARMAADAGAEAIGLNFFGKSRRHVDIDTARRIAAATPNGVTKVGVFVNHSAGEIAHTVAEVGLDAVQLHGDESAAQLPQLPKQVIVIRAYRCGAQGLTPLAVYLEECRALGRLPDAVLLDADAGANFGGSGQLADWTLIHRDRDLAAGLPVVLAGGLTPENVAEAIAAVRPHGVDVASGVEREDGRKDAALVEQFIAGARGAFARLE